MATFYKFGKLWEIPPPRPGWASPSRPPPVDPVALVFISEQPSAPLDPSPPQFNQAPVTSSSRAASLNPSQPVSGAAPATQPARQSRLWNAGGPAGLAALEARDTAERQAQLRHAPREAAAERSARAWANVIHLRLDD